MATVAVSKLVKAPVERVFKLFTDVEHGSSNVSNIKETELLTPGSFRLGTRWRETREVMGRMDEAEMEVTAFELNRTYTITHHKAGVRIDTSFTFDSVPDGTKVSVEFGLNTQGLPPELLSPLEWAIRGKVREVLDHDLADLKDSVEKVLQ